jgi:hypothetical protein
MALTIEAGENWKTEVICRARRLGSDGKATGMGV